MRLTSWLSAFAARRSRNISATASKKRLRRQISQRLEWLEDRSLLAVTPVLASGTLTVTLDATNDHAYLRVNGGGNVEVANNSGFGGATAFAGVTAITVTGSGGNNQAVTFASGTFSLSGALSSTGVETVEFNTSISAQSLAVSGATGGVTQTGALTIATTSDIAAGAAVITLTNTSNDFQGAVTLSNSGANAVAITDTNAILLGTSSVGTSTLTVTAVGITQSGAITQTAGAGTATFNGGAGVITLTQSNNFTGAVSLNNSGANAVSVTDSNAIDLGTSNIGGSLTVLATTGNITDSGTVTVAGTVSLTTSAAGADINLGTLAATGGVTVSTTASNGDVTIVNATALALQGTVNGNLVATATTGNLTDSATLTVSGTSNFTTTAANATILLNSLSATGAIDLNTNGASGNATVVNSIGVILSTPSVGGNLNVTATTGDITDTGTVTVTGTTILTAAVTNDIILDTGTNNFAGIQIVSGRNVTLVDANLLDIATGTSTISGTLSITTSGALTDTGNLVVTGTTTLAAGSGNDITLDSSSNNFSTVAITSGRAVALRDTNGIILGASTATTTLNVTAGGTISQSGVLSATTLTTSSVGGTSLNTSTNTVTGFNATNTTSGNISLTNTTGTLTVTGVSQTGGGDVSVTNTGALTTSGAISTAANGQVNLQATSGVLTVGAAVTAGGAGTVGLTSTVGTNAVLVQGVVTSTLGAITVHAAGAITESGSGKFDTASLSTTSSGGQTLNQGNTVASFSATNTTSGNISLTNTATTLTVSGITQSGGGSVSVVNTGALSTTGAITTTANGNISLQASSGALTIAAAVTANGAGTIGLTSTGAGNVVNPQAAVSSTSGQITVSAGGAITETVSGTFATTGLLSTSSTGGQTLTNANAVGSFTASNATSGAVTLTNTAATLTVTGITQSGTAAGSNVSVTNTGALTTSTAVISTTASANGTISLQATSGVLTVGASGVTAGGSGTVGLTSTGGTNAVQVQGAVSSTSGQITVSAAGAITESGGGTFGTSGLLSTTSVGGQTLNGANTVGSFNASNSTSGNISLTNSTGTLGITGITQTGGGTLTINQGTNGISQSGDIEVGTGALSLTGGTISLTRTNNTFGAITVASGAGDVSLRQDGAMSITAITRTSGNLTLNANGGSSTIGQTGAISIAGGSVDLTGSNITLSNSSNAFGTVTTTSGNNVSLRDDSGFDVGSTSITGALTLFSNGAITQSSALGGGASLVKQGTGTLTLNLTNTYTGATTITTGTVLVTGSTSASSAVGVGGTLGGTGTVGGAVTVGSGGTITGGTLGGVGTLTVGSLAFNGGTYAADFNTNTSDTIVTSGTIDLQETAQGAFTINSQTGTAADNNVFVLINNTHASNAIVQPPLSGAAQGGTTTINTKTGTYSYTGGTGANDFTLTTAGIFTYTGTAGNDSVTVKKTGTDIQIIDTGSNAVLQSIPATAVNSIVINGLDGNDTFTVDFAGGLDKDVTVNGGNPTSGTGDKLVINNGSFTTATFNYTNAHDGSVVLDSRTINYTGLEPVLLNVGTLANAIFNLPNGGNTAFLEDDTTAANGIIQLRSSSATFETTTFTSPSASLTINGGTGNDVLTISDVDSGTFALTVALAGGTDSITQNAVLTLGSGASTGNVSYTADSIAVNAAITNTAGTAGTVTMNADGTTLTIAAAGDISSNGVVSLTGNTGISTAGDITTTNDAVTFNSNTTLTGDIAINTGAGAGTITFSGTLTGTTAGAEDLTLTAGTGNVSFSGVVGGTRLGAILINSATDVTATTITAASVGQSAGTGTTTLNGAVNTNTATGVALTTGAIAVNNTITTTANGVVTFTNAGTLTIAAAGDINADGAVTQNGAGAVTTSGDITTTNDDVSILRAVTLNGAVAINTGAGAGNVLFSSTVDGGQTLNITAGTGNVTFTGAVGGATALTSVTVASATDVTFGSTVRTTGTVTQTAGTGTTTFNGTSGAGIGGTLSITTSAITLNTAQVTTVGSVTLNAQNAISQNANLNAGASTVTIQANQDNAGGQDFTQSATSTIVTTNATAAAVAISVGNTGDAFINSITTSTASPAAVVINVGTGGQIAETADDGATDITTFNLTLTAGTGIGATNGPLEVTVDTLVNANVSGTGAINISDTAGGLNVTTATTNDGAITLNATSGALNLTTVTAGGTANITATTTTSGTISVGNVTATADTISLTAAGGGSIQELGNDGAADVSGGTLNFTVSGAGTVGAAGAAGTVEIDATVVLNVTTAGGSVFIEDTTGGLPVGLVDAGAGNVTLTATGGSMTETAATDAAADIVGATLNLTVTGGASTIGTNAETLEINATTQLNAATAGGNIFLEDTAGGVAVGLVTATTAGNVNLQATNGSMTSFAVDGTADIVGATLNLVVTGAGSDFGTGTATPLEINATVALNATTAGAAGDDAFILDTVTDLPLGLVNVGAGTAYLRTTNGSITDTDAAGNDVTAASVRFQSSGGVGTAADPIETTVTNLAATTGTAGFFVSNTGNLSINTVLTQNGVVTNNQDAIITSTGSISIDQPLNAGVGDARLVAATTVTQAAAGVITANEFGVRAGGSVTLANATPTFNDVDSIAVSTTGLIEFRDADNLTVAAITASGAFTATAGLTSGGSDINVRTGTSLAVDNVINAGAGDVRLVVGNPSVGNITQAAAGVITADELGIRANGFVALALVLSDVNTIAVNADNTVEFADSDNLTVGTVAAGGSALIGFVNTVGITTTNDDTYLETNGGGALVISNAISVGGGDLELSGSGAVTQTAAITATGLALVDNGPFTLTLPTNTVTTIAADTDSTISYVNSGSLIVGTVTVTTTNVTDTTIGIATSNDDVRLTATVGSLTINNTINLSNGGGGGAGGSLDLVATTGATQAVTANILANHLLLRGTGAAINTDFFNLPNATNNVAIIAANLTNGAVTYYDADALTVGIASVTAGGSTTTATGISVGNSGGVAPAGGDVFLRAGQVTTTGLLTVTQIISTDTGIMGNLTIGGGVVFSGAGNTNVGSGDIDLEGGSAVPDIVIDNPTTHNMTGGTVTYRPDRDIFINQPVIVNNGHFVLDADGEDPVVATTIAQVQSNLATGNGVGGLWIRNAGSVDVNTGVNGGGSLVMAGSQINNTPNGAAGYGGLVAGAGVQIDNTTAATEVTAATTISALVKTAGAAGNDMQIDGNIVGDAGGAINVQVEDTFTLNSTISLTTEGNITIDAEDMVINTGTAVIDAKETTANNNSGVVWLRNRTAGREIDLGGNSPFVSLVLTNAELNRISPAEVVRIGRNGLSGFNTAAGAGTITVSALNINLTQNTNLHLITSDDITDNGANGSGGLGTITETNLALEANTGIDLHNVNAVAGTSGNDVDNLAILATGGDVVFKDRDDVNFQIVDFTADAALRAVNVANDLTMIMGGNLTQTNAVAAGGLELIDLFNGAPPPTFLANPTYYLPHSSNTIGQLEAYSQQSVNITNSTTLTVGTVANSYLTFPASGSNGVWVSSLQLTAPTVVVNSPIETNDELGFVTFDVTTLLDINANIFSRGKIEQIGTGVVTVADVELRTTDDNITFLGGVTLDGASLTTPTVMSTDAGWTTPFTGIPVAVDAAAQAGGGSVIFNSTLRSNPSGDTALAYRGNDLTLETGTGNIQFIGQVGGTSGAAGRLGVVNIVDAHDVTASTGFSANAFYQQAGDGETAFNGFVQTNGRRDVLTPAAGTNYGVDITTKMITLNAAMQTTSAPGSGASAAIRLNNSGTMSIVAGAGSINSDGAVSQVGTGNNLVGGDIVTTNDNISFNSDTYLSGTPLQINSGNADVSFVARFQINNKTVTIRDKDFVDLGTVTAIAGGVLNVFVANSATRGSIQAGSGETITGAGTMNTDVSVLTGGTLAPAMDASGLGTGILTINGNVVLGTNAVYAVDLNGTSAGSSYDQVVTGATFTFTATGAILSATRPVTFNPSTGSVLKIIDGSVDVVGNFSNAANGTFVYINGLYFRVDYDVTAGDLTLTRQDPPGAAVTIIDDNGSSPSTPVAGFTLSPNNTTAWSPNSVAGRGYANDLRFAAAGNGSSTALYTFTGLTPGHTYRVSTTWYPHINRATDSPFTVDDGAGGSAAVTTTINQRNNPDDFTSGGSAWEDLVVGGYTISGTTLTVLLTNNTSTGYVIADAVRIEDITGAAPEIVVMDGTTDIPDGTGVVDFGTTSTLGADISKTISIKNTGLSPLVLSSATITAPPGFTISGYTPQTIPAGGTGTPFTITLSHLVAGSFSGQISFNTNDFDENPFNFTVKGGVTSGLTQIADNLSQSGGYNTITGSANNAGTNLMYGEVGPWHNNDDSQVGYLQDLRYAAANSNAQATWTFSGLAAGTYRVSVTFRAEPNRASNASFSVVGTGVVNPTVVSINQRVAPNQFQDANVYWIDLDGAFGTVSAGGTITVTLDALGSNGFVIADAVRVEFLHALQAEDGPAANPTATVLTTADLDATAAAAVARWQQAGLTAAQQATLNGLIFSVANLPDAYLGGETDGTIFVDANAAGYGWYVDSTPNDDAEFGLMIADTELGATDPLAAGQMDLLTVLMHEIGHRLGLDDVSIAAGDHGLMTESLDVGTRRLPVGIAVSEGSVGVEDVSSDSSDALADDVQDEVFVNLGTTATSTPTTAGPTIAVGGSSSGSQGNHHGSGHSTGTSQSGHRHARTGGKPHNDAHESRSLLGTLFSLVRKRR